ncbi:MAG: protein jag [Candidatus Paceibacterota bacterium]
MDTVTIQNLIKDLIEKTISEVAEVKECVLDEKLGGRCFSVEMSNAHPFLAREGEGLHALNHLVRRIIESGNEESEDHKETNVMVDINGFQKKRIDSLKSLVHMMAERARYFKSSVSLDPMSAYERRIVHEFLSDALDLKTESDGAGRNRHVVIKYTGGL